ncbi:hypothetical protein AB0O38_16070 [Pseudarthrobacter oxydans]|uniref:hypothetical protein n=1 Tax=Pseudarthrobacter oxydans TaxID=1671 RepID=UPI0034174B8C
MPKPSIRPADPNDIIKAAPKSFRTRGTDITEHGVGLFAGESLVQFLTPAQALRLANQLADALQSNTKGKKHG